MQLIWGDLFSMQCGCNNYITSKILVDQILAH